MAPVTLTTLRSKLFEMVDQIITTGIPLEIERRGKRLHIALVEKKAKLANLKAQDCIVGDPDDLIHLEVAPWQNDQRV